MYRLGRVARKHGCPEACKRIIVEMYGFNAMEVQEAFIKICEQVGAVGTKDSWPLRTGSYIQY